MSVILFIVILFILVLAHEWGHFIVAKKNGIRVDEFGFGYPPRAIKLFRRNGTDFTLNWLPFGGFVKIFGENPDDENTNGPDKNVSFVHKKARVQAAVLVAGVVMNFLLAWVLLSVGYITGLPISEGSQPKDKVLANSQLLITDVSANSPASLSGLPAGSQIMELNKGNVVVKNPDTTQFKNFITNSEGSEIIVKYTNGIDDNVSEVKITPQKNDAGTPVIGVAIDMVGTLKLPIHEAFWQGLKLSVNITKSIVVSLGTLIGQAFVGKADITTLTGPVGIVKVVGQAYSYGLVYLLSFTAMISLNLAVINLLPFPALDGGRLFFLAIEKITRRKIPQKVFNWANAIGFFILIALMLLVTYHDIAKLVTK